MATIDKLMAHADRALSKMILRPIVAFPEIVTFRPCFRHEIKYSVRAYPPGQLMNETYRRGKRADGLKTRFIGSLGQFAITTLFQPPPISDIITMRAFLPRIRWFRQTSPVKGETNYVYMPWDLWRGVCGYKQVESVAKLNCIFFTLYIPTVHIPVCTKFHSVRICGQKKMNSKSGEYNFMAMLIPSNELMKEIK